MIPLDPSLSAAPLDSMFAQTPQIPTDIQPAPKRGLFGGMFGNNPNAQNAIMAAVGAFMARRNPVLSQAMFGMLANKQALTQQSQRIQQQQDAELSREKALVDYKAAHPETPDIQARIDVLNSLEPGLGLKYAHNYAANGGGLGLVTNPQTGQQYAQPGSLTPPAEAIARLKSNPNEASQFDEIFGQGAAAKILGAGGPTPSASGNFPY